jgi:hypothetical protein
MNEQEFLKRAGPALLDSWPEDAANAFSCICQLLARQGFVPGAVMTGQTSRERKFLGRYVCALVDDPAFGTTFTVYLVLGLDWDCGAHVRLLLNHSNLGFPDDAVTDLFVDNWGGAELGMTRRQWEQWTLPEAQAQMATWLALLFGDGFDDLLANKWAALAGALEREMAP